MDALVDSTSAALAEIEALFEKPQEPLEFESRGVLVVEMHLAGFSEAEIAARTHFTRKKVGEILEHPEARAYIDRRISAMQRQFQGLYSKVLKTLSQALDESRPMEIRLVAADKWLKATGAYSPRKDGKEAVTAEDIVAKLLEGKGTVTVNIDNRKVEVNELRSARGEPPPLSSP